MSRSRHIDRICAVAAAAALIICLALMLLPIPQGSGTEMGYEERLFTSGTVHSIDIIMDDWDSFIASAVGEEYSPCTLVVDGESFANVAIRGKGNTSLSNVSSMGSSRYSFKIEFDHYEEGKSYHGLDKLSLNNLIQDATNMKDYLSYTLMASFGVAAPLCSYVSVAVNGEPWGLYLAVEGIEDSFLMRNYGSDHGELYKPDSMEIGGGRGQGKNFSMDSFNFEEARQEGFSPNNFDRDGGSPATSQDVLLRYSDDSPESYPNIFGNAKTDISERDQSRLIASLKTLSAKSDPEGVLDTEAVLRYFVVHNYLVNGDSYTGGMVHNYYLYAEEGRLSMIPWDYNLAFGTFMGGNAASSVNDPIDSPLSVGSDSRPMIDWIFESDEYTALYHSLFSEFLASVDIPALVKATAEMIAPYVEKDPTAFYSYEEFEAGVKALESFCALRSESVLRQLEGSLASTDEGQAQNPDGLVDAGELRLSDMGSMGGMGGRPEGADTPQTVNAPDTGTPPDMNTPPDMGEPPAMGTAPDMNTPPGMGGRGDRNSLGEAPFPGGEAGMAFAPTLPESDNLSPPSQAPLAKSIGIIVLCFLLLAAGIFTAWRYRR